MVNDWCEVNRAGASIICKAILATRQQQQQDTTDSSVTIKLRVPTTTLYCNSTYHACFSNPRSQSLKPRAIKNINNLQQWRCAAEEKVRGTMQVKPDEVVRGRVARSVQDRASTKAHCDSTALDESHLIVVQHLSSIGATRALLRLANCAALPFNLTTMAWVTWQ